MPAIDYPQQQTGLQGLDPTGKTQDQLYGPSGLYTGILSQAQAMQGTGQQASALQLMQQQQAGLSPQQQPAPPPSPTPAASSVQDLANYLAKSYGVELGRKSLVDEQGNFTRMPQGAEEAAKFNYIAQAIADQQNRQQQAKSIAALQTEAGLVQSRGRGSLAALQSGTYRALAGQYNEMQYVADDFSYFIQEDFMRRQEALVRKAEKLAKKRRQGAMIGAIAGGVIGSVVPGIGTAAGVAVGGAIGGGMY